MSWENCRVAACFNRKLGIMKRVIKYRNYYIRTDNVNGFLLLSYLVISIVLPYRLSRFPLFCI